jgi:hypothetical protein
MNFAEHPVKNNASSLILTTFPIQLDATIFSQNPTGYMFIYERPKIGAVGNYLHYHAFYLRTESFCASQHFLHGRHSKQ